jgi:hypothetical protein
VSESRDATKSRYRPKERSKFDRNALEMLKACPPLAAAIANESSFVS